MRNNYLFGVLLLMFFSSQIFGQQSIIQTFLNENQTQLGLTTNDLTNWSVTDQHVSSVSGAEHVYIVQEYQGIKVFHAVANFAIQQGQVKYMAQQLVSDVASKVNTTQPGITAQQVIQRVAQEYNLGAVNNLQLIAQNGNSYEFTPGGISQENIDVELVYHIGEQDLLLAWDLHIYQLDSKHWWSLRVDALSGEVLAEQDWVLSCTFGEACNHKNHARPKRNLDELPYELCQTTQKAEMAPPPSTDQYNVFDLPVESPNHGGRTLVVGPSNTTASPFGWHDTNGNAGAEFTITRGNNVHAQEDANGNNGTGYSPDGGATLDFNFPLNLNQAPGNYLDPAITNLFYWSNIMHDVWYFYGFDEASGNFQQNNYGRGGFGGDYVRADAQDGSGLNNANMATPTEGNRPRLQMFLWSAPASAPDLFTVNSPGGLAGVYAAEPAAFGAAMPATALTADMAVYNDATPDIEDACEAVTNAAALNGRIVLIRRGSCPFVDKVVRAEAAGAVAVVMVNNAAGAPIVMGGTDPGIGIPAIMISQADGNALIAAVNGGQTVNATLHDKPTFQLDGDFDNVIIAHEYGHGISTRLTGGAGTSCLFNDEQMGEGWSDWFGLMLTIEPGDLSTDPRGIGTYAIGQSPLGGGIRPAPYSTDFGINPLTYGITNNGGISQPHGIGSVWCTMLWDLTWAFIDTYGYDNDLYNGTGGNNMVMELVTEALKLQGCSPGFVSGRDAILQADVLINGGANECLIWNVFANRGVGNSANEGNTNSRSDQVEAFDLPNGILTPLSACQASLSLPIELASYTAEVMDNKTVLNSWMTVSETNNDFFTVERSKDGVNFEPIETLDSKGEGSEIRYYNFEDMQPYAGISYYRLKQTDKDETFSYSEIIAVELDREIDEVQVIPNPNTGQFNVVLETEYDFELNCNVYNVLGEVVLSQQIQQTKGLGTHPVDITDLPTGTYLISITDRSGLINVTKKVIKQ